MITFVVIVFSVLLTIGVAIFVWNAWDTLMTLQEIDRLTPREFFMEEYNKIKSQREELTK
jgi:hypothetical protein